MKRITRQAQERKLDVNNIFNKNRIDELIKSQVDEITPTGEVTTVLKVGQTGVVKDPSGENVVVKKIRD